MKTAVSIPDDVFAGAERLARRLGTSRSRLYARALEEFIARHTADEVTARLDATLEDVGEADRAFPASAGRRTLRRVEW